MTSDRALSLLGPVRNWRRMARLAWRRPNASADCGFSLVNVVLARVHSRWLLCVLVSLLAAANTTASVFELRQFENSTQKQRFQRLTAELRCLVCQNQNIADSNADLAADLRAEVYTMVRAGREDREIIAFMVDRYGEFVLYKPPLNRSTLLLWTGPFVLVIVGMTLLWLQIRRRRGVATTQTSAAMSDSPNTNIERVLARLACETGSQSSSEPASPIDSARSKDSSS